MYDAMHLPLFLELGKQGEVNPTTHLFDVSGLIDGIPNPIVVIWYQPPSGGAYLPLAEFNLEGSTIGWTPSAADLEHAGSGVAELRVYSNANATEVLRKSNLMGIKVRKAGDSTNPGTSPDWVKNLLELYEAWEAGEIGGATDEQVQRAVEEYLEENPPAPYTLPVATSEILGGIKAGEGVEIEEDGTLNVTVEGGSGIMAFSLDAETGVLSVVTPDSSSGLVFEINENGHLEVNING